MNTATNHSDRSSVVRNLRALVRNLGLGLSLLVPAIGVAHADGPGRGATAQFEKNYLVFIINHHYSALRMTELAAGTDLTRDAQVVAPRRGRHRRQASTRPRQRRATTRSSPWRVWETVSSARRSAVPSDS